MKKRKSKVPSALSEPKPGTKKSPGKQKSPPSLGSVLKKRPY